jgi:hypothetical protein
VELSGHGEGLPLARNVAIGSISRRCSSRRSDLPMWEAGDCNADKAITPSPRIGRKSVCRPSPAAFRKPSSDRSRYINVWHPYDLSEADLVGPWPRDEGSDAPRPGYLIDAVSGGRLRRRKTAQRRAGLHDAIPSQDPARHHAAQVEDVCILVDSGETADVPVPRIERNGRSNGVVCLEQALCRGSAGRRKTERRLSRRHTNDRPAHGLVVARRKSYTSLPPYSLLVPTKACLVTGLSVTKAKVLRDRCELVRTSGWPRRPSPVTA